MLEVVIWGAFGIGGGTLWFLYGFNRLRMRRRIQGLATSRIRSMAMGIIELCGRVRLEAPIVDPIFSRPCAYFKITVKEKRGSGKRSRWVTIYRKDSSGTPFLIEDATGLARIFPARAELHFPPEVNSRTGGLFRSQDDGLSAFLSSLGGSSLRSRRVTAYILRDGQPLFAVGYAAPALSASLPATVAPRDAARLLKSSPAEMKKADANGDGVVDPQEWDAGVAKKAEELADQARVRQIAEAPPCDPLITVSRCPDGLFVLANTQENLLSKLGAAAWAGVIGGPVIAVAGLAYLVTNLR